MSVIEKTPQQGNGGKRKPYKKISDTLRAKIGKYALKKGAQQLRGNSAKNLTVL